MELKKIKDSINLLEYAIQNSVSQVKKAGRNTYWLNPCPVCDHKDHFTIYPESNSYSSFSGCCKGGDIIDYLQEVEGMNQAQAIDKTRQLAGVDREQPALVPQEKEEKQTDTQRKAALSLIEKASKNTCEYYYQRGLTDKTIKTYKLGYLPDGQEYGKQYKYLIPLDGGAYTIRCVKNNEKAKYMNSRGPAALLNEKYLQDPTLTGREIFITEGAIDALSLEELDRQAIALNSTAGKTKLLQALKANQENLKDKLLIIALDTDEAGEKTAKEILQEAQALGLPCMPFSLNGHKDINESLINDREGLQQQLEDIPLQGSVYAYLQDEFEADQAKRLSEPDIKTCITALDKALGGGLYPGLYVLGSISSLGKTALALQIADRIATAQQQVLFLSLEMARYEMTCRSLTRALFEKTSNDSITTGHVLKSSYQGHALYSTDEFKKVLQAYREGPAKHLTLIEGDFDITIDKIQQLVKEHISRTGFRPVVIIDYLQVIRPPQDSRLTDKQHIDQVVVALKRMSRNLDLPVIAISSFNRASYNNEEGPTMASYKESGAIEYTADVLLSMQLKKGNKGDDINKFKIEEPRLLKLVILKNRRGMAYEEIELEYYTRQNYFTENLHC